MKRAWWVVSVVVAVAGCFSLAPLQGSYLCGANAVCGQEGQICWDGVCCNPYGDPPCLGYVYDGGVCADGGSAEVFYEDLDRDGVGAQGQQRLYCHAPASDPFVRDAGDCDDRPEIGKASRPGLDEVCDGRDNDCDGTNDENLPQKTFYKDQDGDGYGDPNQSTTACAAPEGYVENDLDCEPISAISKPGGIEICNGFDDDCNGIVDDNLTGFGQSCTVAGKQGVCMTGATACVAGKSECVQTVQPSPDICDNQDNDCDGTTDEKPDCRGPANLLTSANLGAKGLAPAALDGISTSCLKDYAAGTPDSFGSNGVWTGSDPYTHVAWAEAPAGQTWDLRNAELKVYFSYNITNAANPPWSQHNQPVILVCSVNGFVRMFYSAGRLLNTATSGTLTPRIALGKTMYGWIVGTYSSANVDDVLRQANRIEVQIQASGASAQWQISFIEWGFY